MPHVKLGLEVGHDLPLLGDPLADEDGPHVGLHQGAVPHVPHPGTLGNQKYTNLLSWDLVQSGHNFRYLENPSCTKSKQLKRYVHH